MSFVYKRALPVDINAGTVLPRACQALFIGGAGSITVDMAEIASAEAYVTSVDPTTGAILAITLHYGGFGYLSAPTVNITDVLGSGANVSATVVNGAVTSLTINNGGTGYSIDRRPQTTFTGGRGNGTTLAVTAGILPIAVSKVYQTTTGTAASHAFGAGNSEITITANAVGVAGDSITISFVADTTLSVSVVGNNITVNLATSGSTVTAVIAAIAANGPANALVTASTTGDGSGNVGAAGVTALSGGVDASPGDATGVQALYV